MHRIPDSEWQARIEEHQREIARLLEVIMGLEDATWTHRPAPDKWCAGQVAEHLLLTYDAMLRELAGGVGMRVRTSWWKRLLLRARYLPMILKEGKFPPGAPAVREIRPGQEPRGRAVLVDELRARAARFGEELTRAHASGGRVTHPFFGRLNPFQTLRLATVHLAHHRRQIPTP